VADSPGGGVIATAARGSSGGHALLVLLLDRVPPMAGFLARLLVTRAVQQCDRLLTARPELCPAFVPLGARRADVHSIVDPQAALAFCLAEVREELPYLATQSTSVLAHT
jgi:hypothetical protein